MCLVSQIGTRIRISDNGRHNADEVQLFHGVIDIGDGCRELNRELYKLKSRKAQCRLTNILDYIVLTVLSHYMGFVEIANCSQNDLSRVYKRRNLCLTICCGDAT